MKFATNSARKHQKSEENWPKWVEAITFLCTFWWNTDTDTWNCRWQSRVLGVTSQPCQGDQKISNGCQRGGSLVIFCGKTSILQCFTNQEKSAIFPGYLDCVHFTSPYCFSLTSFVAVQAYYKATHSKWISRVRRIYVSSPAFENRNGTQLETFEEMSFVSSLWIIHKDHIWK